MVKLELCAGKPRSRPYPRGAVGGNTAGLPDEASILKRLLRFRFGDVPRSYEAFLDQADLETLEALSQELLEAKTLPDLFKKWMSE